MKRINIIEYIEKGSHHFINTIKLEYKDAKEAKEIIQKYLEVGSITEEEEKILKSQLIDSLKIVGIVIPFVLIPGASILMPILIKICEKKGIELLPASFNEKNHEPFISKPKKVKIKKIKHEK